MRRKKNDNGAENIIDERQTLSCKKCAFSHGRAVRDKALKLLSSSALHERPDFRGVRNLRLVLGDGLSFCAASDAEHFRLDDDFPSGQGELKAGNHLNQPEILFSLACGFWRGDSGERDFQLPAAFQ